MSSTIFYSWQSDRSTKEGRNLIERALEAAVKRISDDITVEASLRDQLRLDKDTKDAPGSPPIFQTILDKIDAAAVVVADLTICGSRQDGRFSPNPNVLIEYGFALKALGHGRLIAVMNVAHGKPSRDSLPFNLADRRFPIVYEVPDDAVDEVRRQAREKLSKELEDALRNVLQSAEFKGGPSPMKHSGPPQFVCAVPQEGNARFRPRGKPLGFVRDSFAQRVGQPSAIPIHLAEGAASWARVMPLHDPSRKWKTSDLKQPALNLATIAMMAESGNGSFGFLEADDGCGYFAVFDNKLTYAVAYVFKTGEVWIVNSRMGRVSEYFELDEKSFVQTLDVSATFLSAIGCPKPYRWEVGLEGVQERKLSTPENRLRNFGKCLANQILLTGSYENAGNTKELLRPFFEEVFDQCGSSRA
jgi:hypothetical protein